MSVSGTVHRYLKLRGFSWKLRINHFAPRRSSSDLGIDPRDLPRGSPYVVKPAQPIAGWFSVLRPPIAVSISTGIFTGFPSTTPFGLALGADSPCADCRCAGTLGLAACGVFTRMIVTHVSIRTSDTSNAPDSTPSSAYGTLPYHALASIRSFGRWLKPR